jgi:hypothetical protein
MKKPRWWSIYKPLIIFFSIPGILLLLIGQPIGLILLLILALLFIQQTRREKTWVEEKRHQETLEALRQSKSQY